MTVSCRLKRPLLGFVTAVALLLVSACGEDAAGPAGNPEDAAWWDGFAASQMTAVAVAEYNGTPIAAGYVTPSSDPAWSPVVARWTGSTWETMLTLGRLLEVDYLGVWNGELVMCEWSSWVDSSGTRIHTWDGASWRETPRMDFRVWCAAEYGGVLALGGAIGPPLFPQTSLAASWDGTVVAPLGSGAPGPVGGALSLAAYQGKLIANGTHALEGGTWVPWADGLVDPLIAGHLAVGGADLYAVVSDVSGSSATLSIQRYDGASWTVLGEVTPDPYQPVSDMVFYNGTVVVAGDLSGLGGIGSGSAIARWDSAAWGTFGSSVSGKSYRGVGALITDLFAVGNRLYVAGSFTHAGGRPSEGVARWEG